jgi:hypothetical protein
MKGGKTEVKQGERPMKMGLSREAEGTSLENVYENILEGGGKNCSRGGNGKLHPGAPAARGIRFKGRERREHGDLKPRTNRATRKTGKRKKVHAEAGDAERNGTNRMLLRRGNLNFNKIYRMNGIRGRKGAFHEPWSPCGGREVCGRAVFPPGKMPAATPEWPRPPANARQSVWSIGGEQVRREQGRAREIQKMVGRSPSSRPFLQGEGDRSGAGLAE